MYVAVGIFLGAKLEFLADKVGERLFYLLGNAFQCLRHVNNEHLSRKSLGKGIFWTDKALFVRFYHQRRVHFLAHKSPCDTSEKTVGLIHCKSIIGVAVVVYDHGYCVRAVIKYDLVKYQPLAYPCGRNFRRDRAAYHSLLV